MTKLDERKKARDRVWAGGWSDYFEDRPEGMTLTDALLFDLVLAANALMEVHYPTKREGDEWKT